MHPPDRTPLARVSAIIASQARSGFTIVNTNPIRWGILSTAGIALRSVGPGIRKAEWGAAGGGEPVAGAGAGICG